MISKLVSSIILLIFFASSALADFEEDLSVSADYPHALRELRARALAGDAYAQLNMGGIFILGVMYANGQGVGKDLLESYRWTRLAANQGHLLARNLMADLVNQMTPEQTVLAAKLAVSAKNNLSSEQAGENSLAVEIAEKSIRQDLRIWANAWSAKRMQAYFDAYIAAYKPEGISHAQWKAQRTAHINKPNTITLDLRNLIIKVMDDTHASVSFTQNYRSDIHQDLQKKTLQMIKSQGRWLISAEQTERADAMPLMRNHKIH